MSDDYELSMEDDDVALSKALKHLTSRFECVQIIVSRFEEDGKTVFGHKGFGNHFTRIGMLFRWLMLTNEANRD